MRRFWLLAVLVTSVAVCGSWLSAQEKKDGKDAKDDSETKVEGRIRGQLPANYRNLGLDDKQRQAVYKIQAIYDAKIAELEAQIKKLKQDERLEIEKLLTPAQKARLKEIMKEKSGLESDKDGGALKDKGDK